MPHPQQALVAFQPDIKRPILPPVPIGARPSAQLPYIGTLNVLRQSPIQRQIATLVEAHARISPARSFTDSQHEAAVSFRATGPIQLGRPVLDDKWISDAAYNVQMPMSEFDEQAAVTTTAPPTPPPDIPPQPYHLVAFACCFLALVCFNIVWYFVHPSEEHRASRCEGWDVARFWLEMGVIFHHCWMKLFFCGWPYYSQYVFAWDSAWLMPAFVFTAGVFGASVSYKSMSSMLCCTCGTNCMAIILILVVNLAVLGDWNYDPTSDGLWFLWGIALWRVLISPPMYFLNAWQTKHALGKWPACCFIAGVHVVSYFPMHAFDLLNFGDQWPGHASCEVVFYAPYFACGLLFSPAQWTSIFQHGITIASSVVYLVVWYGLLAWGGDVYHSWNDAYRNHQDTNPHMPDSSRLGGITIQTFIHDTEMAILRIGVMLSVACILVAGSSHLAKRFPVVISFMAGWGSRTMFAYVLHRICTAVLIYYGFKDVVRNKHNLPSLLQLPVAFLMTLMGNVVLSSQGTEWLFRWMLMPLWMRDGLEWICGCTMKTSGLKEEPSASADTSPAEKLHPASP